MYENHPILIYLDDTFQVADFLALGQQVDGFLLRGVKNIYDTKVRPGVPTINTDTWKAATDAQQIDMMYFTRYDLIRQHFPTKPIYMVIEGNPAVDRNDYKPHDTDLLGQLTVVRQAVQTTRYLPDAFLVKIVDYQWWENGRLVDCTPTNFADCYTFFFQTLFEKYRKETEGWSLAVWIKHSRAGFIDTLDTWNNPAFGGPRHPFAFSYYHNSVPNGRTLESLRSMLAELQEPTGIVTDTKSPFYGQGLKSLYLTAGTYTGFDLEEYGCYGLWGFDQNNFFAGVTNLQGQPKALEVFTHGLPVAEWKTYIQFVDDGGPVDDTTPPSTPAGLTAGILDGVVYLGWDASSDTGGGVVDYAVIRDGLLHGRTTLLDYADNTVVPGNTYTYHVVATDEAGNESLPSNPVTVTVSGGSEPPADPSLAVIAQDVAAIRALLVEQNALLRAIFRTPDGV